MRALLGTVLAAAAAAQVPVPVAKPGTSPAPAAPATDRTVAGSCSAAVSRELFAGCDLDGDDRLDVLELTGALGGGSSAPDLAAAARFDSDRDGFVTWPEFDAVLQSTVQRGGVFRVRPGWTPAPVPTTAAPAPAAGMLVLHDADGDGGLDAVELAQYARVAKRPAELATVLLPLDRDRSGRLEAAELAVWLGPQQAAIAATPLPRRWREFDVDRSGTLDAREFALALPPVGEHLVHWAPELLRRFDRDGDGLLAPDELTEASTER